MSAFSTANQARFTRLFSRYGSNGESSELQIIQTTGRVVDQVNQTRSAGTSITSNLVGMVSRFENEIFGGRRVELDDVLVNINSAIAPRSEDTIIISGRSYTIIGIQEIKTNEVIMGYVMHLRK